jgi:hypothetical protein
MPWPKQLRVWRVTGCNRRARWTRNASVRSGNHPYYANFIVNETALQNVIFFAEVHGKRLNLKPAVPFLLASSR